MSYVYIFFLHKRKGTTNKVNLWPMQLPVVDKGRQVFDYALGRNNERCFKKPSQPCVICGQHPCASILLQSKLFPLQVSARKRGNPRSVDGWKIN